MGYSINQTDSSFKILKANQGAAFQVAITTLDDSGYSWIDKNWKNDLQTIQDVLRYWLYEPKTDAETGDITDVQFTCEKIGDEFELFKAIAPFVEKGSFIEIVGEDGSKWRWIFDGTTCNEVYPKVEWGDE